MAKCKHGIWLESENCTRCYVSGLMRLEDGRDYETEVARCVRAFEAIRRVARDGFFEQVPSNDAFTKINHIAMDMLNDEKRAGPTGNVRNQREGKE